MPTRAVIGLGSNLAHPRRQLAKALARLDAIGGVRVLAVSPSYVTAPIGGMPQPDYVNAVALVETTLAPHALLARMQAIERRQQRRRDPATPRNAPRTLDLDLLIYGARRMRSARLTVPHPRMHVRAFVLRPLTDILPGVRAQRIRRTRTHRTLT